MLVVAVIVVSVVFVVAVAAAVGHMTNFFLLAEEANATFQLPRYRGTSLLCNLISSPVCTRTPLVEAGL